MLITTMSSEQNPVIFYNSSLHPERLYFNLVSLIIERAKFSGLYLLKVPFFKNSLTLCKISSSKN